MPPGAYENIGCVFAAQKSMNFLQIGTALPGETRIEKVIILSEYKSRTRRITQKQINLIEAGGYYPRRILFGIRRQFVFKIGKI